MEEINKLRNKMISLDNSKQLIFEQILYVLKEYSKDLYETCFHYGCEMRNRFEPIESIELDEVLAHLHISQFVDHIFKHNLVMIDILNLKNLDKFKNIETKIIVKSEYMKRCMNMYHDRRNFSQNELDKALNGRKLSDLSFKEKIEIFVHLPDEEKTPELCEKRSITFRSVIPYIPPKYRSKEICERAVTDDCCNLMYVPKGIRDEEMCLLACRSHGITEMMVDHIPDEYYEKCLPVALQTDKDDEMFFSQILRYRDVKSKYGNW